MNIPHLFVSNYLSCKSQRKQELQRRRCGNEGKQFILLLAIFQKPNYGSKLGKIQW